MQVTAIPPASPDPCKAYVLQSSPILPYILSTEQQQLLETRILFYPRIQKLVLFVTLNMPFHTAQEGEPKSAKNHHQNWILALKRKRWFFNFRPVQMCQDLKGQVLYKGVVIYIMMLQVQQMDQNGSKRIEMGQIGPHKDQNGSFGSTSVHLRGYLLDLELQ